MKTLAKRLLFMVACCFVSSGTTALTVDFSFTTGCLGTPTTLMSTSTTTPPDTILALLWDLDMDGLFDDAVGTTVVWTFTSIGNHPAGLQVVTLNGSIDAIYKDVPVSGVQASFSFSAGCMGEPIQFTDLSATFADSILLRNWDFGDGSPPVDTKNPQHTYATTGTFPVSLWLITTLECQDSLTNEIVMQPPPVVEVIFSADTAAFNEDTLLVEVFGVFDSVRWNGSVPGTFFMITAAGSYSVTAYKDGCFTTTDFKITDHTSPSPQEGIMTLFTPNGDGFNDFWVIKDMEMLGTCSVRVFNNWGSQVYENPDYQNTWDGRSDNGEVPSGPYYYVASFANGEVYKGTVNILR